MPSDHYNLERINRVAMKNNQFFQTLLCNCDKGVTFRIQIWKRYLQSQNFAYTSVTLAPPKIVLERRLFQAGTGMVSTIRNTSQLVPQENGTRSIQTLRQQV